MGTPTKVAEAGSDGPRNITHLSICHTLRAVGVSSNDCIQNIRHAVGWFYQVGTNRRKILLTD